MIKLKDTGEVYDVYLHGRKLGFVKKEDLQDQGKLELLLNKVVRLTLKNLLDSTPHKTSQSQTSIAEDLFEMVTLGIFSKD